MDAPLAARLELEVLHRIGDVDRAAVHARLLHRPVHDLSGGADERTANHVFLVARLLAHENDPRTRRPFPEHGLGRSLIKVAALAA